MSKNYLQTEVQAYYNVWDKDPKRVNLEYLLNLSTKYLDKGNKRELPCFQPSALGVGRGLTSVYSHTGMVQLDFDYKDNPSLEMHQVRERLIDMLVGEGNVVCAQTSAGGKGVWALLAVEGLTKDNHSELAEAIEVWVFDMFGYTLDFPVLKNLASLRFLSPVNDMKINESAIPVKL